MKIKFDFEIIFRDKNSHHNPISDKERKEIRNNLKGNCIVCDKKITERYRRKVCSEKCAVIYDKQRKHKKIYGKTN